MEDCVDLRESQLAPTWGGKTRKNEIRFDLTSNNLVLPVEGGRKKRRQKGRLAISLTAPELFSEVADGVACNGYSDCVSLLREPAAGNPHIRFDERDVEMEA
jgi:hypothetical protein